MKTARRLLRVTSFTIVMGGLVLVSTGAAATPKSPTFCTRTAVVDDSCVGFYGPMNSDPRTDAITNLLDQHRTSLASKLQKVWASKLSPAAKQTINSLRNDLKAEAAVPDAVPMDQTVNGQCCATSYYHWTYNYPILTVKWGACDGSTCETAGSIVVDDEVDVFDYPIANYFEQVTYNSGAHPTFSNNTVSMWQDKANATDPKVKTYSCPSGSGTTTSLFCSNNQNGPTAINNWYYVQTKLNLNSPGWPTVPMKYESRRWNVINVAYASFEAYYNGG